MKPTTLILTDDLISKVTGAEQENDQHLKLWVENSSLYAVFSDPTTQTVNSFIRVPLKGSLLETHVVQTPNKCSVIRIGGVDSPFVLSQEKLDEFIKASTRIEV